MIDWDVLALPKGESASEGRRRRKKSKAELLQDAYDEVDRLDKLTCWVTGRTLRKGSVDARNRLERHHSYGRRAHPEKRHDPNFIFSVAAEVHEALTLGKLEQEGLDRRHAVFFHWNCPPAQRHFEIEPKRLRALRGESTKLVAESKGCVVPEVETKKTQAIES